MSANYNTALLRQLQSPLFASLEKMEGEVGRVVSGDLPAKEMGISQQAHEAASGLSMIGRQAIAKLAHGISQTIRRLSSPESQGWDKEKSVKVAKRLQVMIQAFTTHLQDMVNGGAELHVRLWPLWAELAAEADMDAPEVEDLFEVDPDFSDISFTPRPLAFLQQIVPPAYDRLVSAIDLVEVARNDEEMERALEKALEVFTQLYGLRHRRAYQAYWLIIRARISVGLIKASGLLEEKKQWLSMLRDAGIQMRKFGQDHRRLPPEKVRSALLPLLDPWPRDWISAHPVLAELDRRLGLSVFWHAVEEIKAEGSAGASAQFSLRQREIEEIVQRCRSTWVKVVSLQSDQRRAAAGHFLRALAALWERKDWFPGTMVAPMFDALQALGDEVSSQAKVKTMPAVDADLAQEVASSILLMEEVIERRVRWSNALERRIHAQARRLSLAVGGRKQELAELPTVRWDQKWRARQVDMAIRLAIAQALVHSDLIEQSLSDLFRGEDEDEIRERFDEFQARCRVMGLVLATLRQPAAARLALGLRTQISDLASSPRSKEKQDPTALARVLTSLSRFLHARRNGDADAGNLLIPGFEALWGEGSYQKMMEEAQPESPPQDSEEDYLVPPSTPALEGSSPAPSSTAIDATPPRDIGAQLLGEGTWDTPVSENIVPIFLEEASEALSDVEGLRKALRENPRDEAAWGDLRRQFHTLKGSGRIAGFLALGEVAWWVEKRLNESILVKEVYSDRLDEALGLASTQLSQWYGQIERKEEGVVQASEIRAALDAAPVVMPPGSSADEAADSEMSQMDDEDISAAWGEHVSAESEGSSGSIAGSEEGSQEEYLPQVSGETGSQEFAPLPDDEQEQEQEPAFPWDALEDGADVQDEGGESLSPVPPSVLRDQEGEEGGGTQAQKQEQEQEIVATEEDISAEGAALGGAQESEGFPESVREAAYHRADDLASVLIQFEMNGEWSLPRLHLAAQSIRELPESGDYPDSFREVCGFLEDYTTAALALPGGKTPMPPEGLIDIVGWVRAVMDAIASESAPSPGEVQEEWVDELRAHIDSLVEGEAVQEDLTAPGTFSKPQEESSQESAEEAEVQEPEHGLDSDSSEDDESEWDIRLEGNDEVQTLSPSDDEVPGEHEDSPSPETGGPGVDEEESPGASQEPSLTAPQDANAGASSEKTPEALSELQAEPSAVEDVHGVVPLESETGPGSSGDPEAGLDQDQEGLPFVSGGTAPAPIPDEQEQEQEQEQPPKAGEDPHQEARVSPRIHDEQATRDAIAQEDGPSLHDVAETALREDSGSERDAAWEEVFQSINAVQEGFSRLSRALLKLNEQDYRD